MKFTWILLLTIYIFGEHFCIEACRRRFTRFVYAKMSHSCIYFTFHFLIMLINFLITMTSCQTAEIKKCFGKKCKHIEKETLCFAEKQYFVKKQFIFIFVKKQHYDHPEVQLFLKLQEFIITLLNYFETSSAFLWTCEDYFGTCHFFSNTSLFFSHTSHSFSQ